MKFFPLILALFSVQAFAGGELIKEPVPFKNDQFSALVLKALKKSVKPVAERHAGADVAVYTVEKGLECREVTALVSGGKKRTTAYCSMLPEGKWKYMGMESYGSGDNEKFSLALFAALDVKASNEQGIQIKTIELNVADPRGGTERNQLSCVKPGQSAVRMGFRPTCQLTNAL